ncbi:MAG: hypothetical protein IPL81_15835 [Flavobacteriales bacterium]|nr:hypothetical protein [Flavobacteriales bacterium]
MDRNSIIGLLLIIAILFGYQYLTMPSAEERARMQHEQDSIAEVAIKSRRTMPIPLWPTSSNR